MPHPAARRPRRRALALTLAVPLVLAACTGDTESPTDVDVTATTTAGTTDQPTGAEASASAAADAADALAALSIEDPWLKATEGLGEEGSETDFAMMTGAFGTITNTSEQDVHVAAVTTGLTERAELHETVMVDGAMTMQQMQDGFTVPAGGELVLEPGGNHLMLMELSAPIRAGEDVELQLLGEDDEVLLTITATARTYAGANEEYADHGE